MREILLDTETTGMNPPTGNHYHVYINPERDVPADCQRKI